MSSSSFFVLIHLVKTAMLVMKPEERESAQDCLDMVPELWENIFQDEDFDPASGAITQAHSDGSFEPSPLGSSRDDETKSSNLSNVIRHASSVDLERLYDPARIDPSPSYVSDH